MTTLIKNWSLIRITKLAIGIGFSIGFWKTEEFVLLFIGIYFLIQSLLNSGCNDNCRISD